MKNGYEGYSQLNVFELQSKTSNYLVYYNARQGKYINPQIWEASNIKCLAFCLKITKLID